MNVYAVSLIAGNEFYKMIRNPLTWFGLIIAFALASIHALGYTVFLPSVESEMHGSAFIIGMGNSVSYTSLITTFLALSVGIFTMSGERSNSSIRVLLTKPVYRRDVILGKIVGLGAFLSLMVLIIVTLSVSSILVSYGGPGSSDILERIIFYGLILIANSILTLGIAVLIGLVFKDLSLSLIVGILYMYFSHTSEIMRVMDSSGGLLSLLNPRLLFGATMVSNGIFLFDPTIPFISWIGSSGPYIILIAVEAIAVLVICCLAFTYEEV